MITRHYVFFSTLGIGGGHRKQIRNAAIYLRLLIKRHAPRKVQPLLVKLLEVLARDVEAGLHLLWVSLGQGGG